MEEYYDQSWDYQFEQPAEENWNAPEWNLIGSMSAVPIKMQIDKMKKKTQAAIAHKNQVTKMSNSFDDLKETGDQVHTEVEKLITPKIAQTKPRKQDKKVKFQEYGEKIKKVIKVKDEEEIDKIITEFVKKDEGKVDEEKFGKTSSRQSSRRFRAR